MLHLTSKLIYMKIFIVATLAICFSSTSYAQQRKVDTSKVVFIPPKIVKDSEVKKFAPPIVVKDSRRKSKRKNNEVVKFAPPVIKKNN